jgi:DNA-binding XRE family transcriptional regulator
VKKLPNSTDVYVGSRVRMRRLMLKMSQTALGTALGLTFQQVQKYEKGTNRIGFRSSLKARLSCREQASRAEHRRRRVT